MAVDVQFTDNSPQVLQDLKSKIEAALEAVGNQAVSHAKQNITAASRVDTGAMRNSMNHLVQGNDCYVGTNQEYAIYHEFGTGIYCEGGGGRQTPWTYQDSHGEWHRTRGLRPIHFLKNAIAEHTSEYQQIIEQQLRN